MAITIEKSKGKNVTYVIDDQKKTVKAILHTDPYEPQETFTRKFESLLAQRSAAPVRPFDCYQEEYNTCSRYIGVAKCHETDTFNKEFGKQLALARAKKKHNAAVAAEMNKMLTFLGDLTAAIIDTSAMISVRLDLANRDERELLAR